MQIPWERRQHSCWAAAPKLDGGLFAGEIEEEAAQGGKHLGGSSPQVCSALPPTLLLRLLAQRLGQRFPASPSSCPTCNSITSTNTIPPPCPLPFPAPVTLKSHPNIPPIPQHCSRGAWPGDCPGKQLPLLPPFLEEIMRIPGGLIASRAAGIAFGCGLRCFGVSCRG